MKPLCNQQSRLLNFSVLEKIKFTFILGALSALLCINPNALQAQTHADVFYSGRLWVQVDPGLTQNLAHDRKEVDKEAFLSALNLVVPEVFELDEVRKPFFFARSKDITEVYELRFAHSGMEAELIALLKQNDGVRYAERVPIMRPTLTPNDLGPQSGTNNQYGLWNINAQAAWDISTGSAEIKVAIVDDAVLVTHPDLIPNLVAGYDVADGDNDPMPNLPAMTHGTHVAGIVGAATNNGIGVASIGFNLKIIPVKSSNQATTITDAYAGVIWAADNGADVINMSWGGSGFSQTGQNIINYASSQGCVNVAAAGNDGVNSIFYPAGYNNVLSVASTTTNDSKSGFSNYGTWIGVSAPGSNIRSTYHNNFQPNYAAISGTSMASPMVAGLAGLVLSVNPELSQVQVRECIVNTADNIDAANPGFVGQLGGGRINAFAAVSCAQATLTAPPVAVINSDANVVCPGSVVQFSGASTGGLATSYSWNFPGGNPSTSTDQNPLVVYSEVGFYDVTLNVINDYGENELTADGYMEVSSNGVDQFFEEDFESGSLTEMGWSVANPDNGTTWQDFTVGGAIEGSKAAGINLFSYPAVGARDGLITPPLSFTGHSNVTLDFQHAHRRRNANIRDSLIVYVSTDGGASFPHRVFQAAEGGGGNFATGAILNQSFVPANGGDWCFGGDIGSGCFTLDLSDFDGEGDVRIKFESYNNNGNNLYIDNVRLSGNCLPTEEAPVAGLQAGSTGICAGESVQFIDQSINVPTTYSWIFDGGTPATSDLATPVVSYANTGIYGVSLTVSNAFGSDEIVFEDYISVSNPPTITIEASATSICAGQSVELNGSGASEYAWAPIAGLSNPGMAQVTASPAATITYTLTGSTDGCSNEESITIAVLPAPPVPQIISGNQTSFTVLNPSSVQGHYAFSPTGAGWGSPPLASLSLEAPMVIARDNSNADSLLCNPASNAAAINGKIAVLYRGGCEFGTKALNAQNAGAIGVVVVNNASGATIEMGPGAAGANVNIPAIMVSNIDGAWFNSAINSGNASAVLGGFNGGSFNICPGETVRLAAQGGLADYAWSNGHSSAVIEISEAGNYSIEFDNGTCATASSVFQVAVYDVVQPVIEWDSESMLNVSNVSGVSYQWFLDGEAITGATSSSHLMLANGVYTVATTDSNGCTSISDPFDFSVANSANMEGKPALKIYPVPSRNRITAVLPPSATGQLSIRVYSAEGRLMALPFAQIDEKSSIEIDISTLAPGTYLLQAIGDAGVYNERFVKVD
jgi:serine protease